MKRNRNPNQIAYETKKNKLSAESTIFQTVNNNALISEMARKEAHPYLSIFKIHLERGNIAYFHHLDGFAIYFGSITKIVDLLKHYLGDNNVKIDEKCFLYVDENLFKSFLEMNNVSYKESTELTSEFINKLQYIDNEYIEKMKISFDIESRIYFMQCQSIEEVNYIKILFKKIESTFKNITKNIIQDITDNTILFLKNDVIIDEVINYFSISLEAAVYPLLRNNKSEHEIKNSIDEDKINRNSVVVSNSKSILHLSEQKTEEKSKINIKKQESSVFFTSLRAITEMRLYILPSNLLSNTGKMRLTSNGKPIARIFVPLNNVIKTNNSDFYYQTKKSGLNFVTCLTCDAFVVFSRNCSDQNELFSMINDFFESKNIQKCKNLSEISQEVKDKIENMELTNEHKKEIEKKVKDMIKNGKIFPFNKNQNEYYKITSASDLFKRKIKNLYDINIKEEIFEKTKIVYMTKENFLKICDKVGIDQPPVKVKKEISRKNTNNHSTTLVKKQFVDSLFKDESFIKISGVNAVIFFRCQNEEHFVSLRHALLSYKPFKEKAKVQLVSSSKNECYFIYFELKGYLEDYLNENKISLNTTEIFETPTFKYFFDTFEHGKRPLSVINEQKKLLHKIRINTLISKSKWVVDEKNNTGKIIFNEEVVSNNPYFHSYCFEALDSFRQEKNLNFSFIKRTKYEFMVKNIKSLLDGLLLITMTKPIVEEKNDFNWTKTNQKKPFMEIKKYFSPKKPLLNDESPFPSLNKIEYTNLLADIREKLPPHLGDFVLTPKTTFHIGSDEQIQLLNAVVSVINKKNFSYQKMADWEDNFYIGFVDKLLHIGLEMGVFAFKDCVFKSGEFLCVYPGQFQEAQPADMGLVYTLPFGFVVPQESYNLVPFMNTTLSEMDSHIQVMLNKSNPQTLDVKISTLIPEEIKIKENEQFLNFFGSDYRITMMRKKIKMVSLNKWDGNLSLSEEYNKLKNEYISEGSLSDTEKEKLKKLKSDKKLFNENYFSDKELLLPLVMQSILSGEHIDKRKKLMYSKQVNYPLLLQKKDILCKRNDQPDITPLMLAFYFANYKAIQTLTLMGAALNCGDINLRTFAFYLKDNLKRQINLIEKAAELPVDLTMQDQDGNTLMHYLISFFSEKKAYMFIKIFLEKSQNTLEWQELENKDSLTVFDCALRTNNFKLIKLLKNYSIDSNYHDDMNSSAANMLIA